MCMHMFYVKFIGSVVTTCFSISYFVGNVVSSGVFFNTHVFCSLIFARYGKSVLIQYHTDLYIPTKNNNRKTTNHKQAMDDENEVNGLLIVCCFSLFVVTNNIVFIVLYVVVAGFF